MDEPGKCTVFRAPTRRGGSSECFVGLRPHRVQCPRLSALSGIAKGSDIVHHRAWCPRLSALSGWVPLPRLDPVPISTASVALGALWSICNLKIVRLAIPIQTGSQCRFSAFCKRRRSVNRQPRDDGTDCRHLRRASFVARCLTFGSVEIDYCLLLCLI